MTDTLRSRTDLKNLFETGDTPVGSDYNDWITTMATQSGENIFSADAQTFLGSISAVGSVSAAALFVNNLSIMNLPSADSGLPAGAIWYDPSNNNVLKLVPFP